MNKDNKIPTVNNVNFLNKFQNNKHFSLQINKHEEKIFDNLIISSTHSTVSNISFNYKLKHIKSCEETSEKLVDLQEFILKDCESLREKFNEEMHKLCRIYQKKSDKILKKYRPGIDKIYNSNKELFDIKTRACKKN